MEEEFNWDLFETDQNEFNERMTRAAFENTYLILTGKATYESMLERESMQTGSIDQYVNTSVLFNPMSDNYSPKFPHLHNQVDRDELIDTLIAYYTESEEYEKCSDLVKLKKTLC